MGNCTFVSSKEAIKALLALGTFIDWPQMSDGEESRVKMAEKWEKAFDCTRQLFFDWESWDMTEVLSDLVECADEALYRDTPNDRIIHQYERTAAFIAESVLLAKDRLPLGLTKCFYNLLEDLGEHFRV